jgi:hypothetical protein
MTYLGEVHNGVVVLKDAPVLEEGTKVKVEVETPLTPKLRVGSPEAVLAGIEKAGGWVGPEGELDRLLEELREMKQQEVRLQMSQPEPEL